jgi:hypothetical protein
MTAICGGGTSSFNPTVGQNIVVTTAAAEALLDVISEGTALIAAPFLAGLTYDLLQICATDPPALPTIGPDDWKALLAGPGPATVTGVLQKFIDYFVHFAWYSWCHCDTAPTPSQPSPVTVTGQPSVGGGIGTAPTPAPCLVTGAPDATITPADQQVFVQQGHVFPPNAQNGEITIFWLPSGIGNESTAVMTIWCVDGNGNILNKIARNFFSNTSGVIKFDIPVGTNNILLDVNQLTFPNIDKLSYQMALYCAGSRPGDPLQACCPPDTSTSLLLTQIRDMVTLIQRQIVPFAYVPGTVHSGLTGNGELTVQGLLGVKIDPTSFPPVYGTEDGDPDSLWLNSWIRWGNGDGWTQRERLTSAPFVSLPSVAGQFTKLGYTLAPGLVATITELVREP